MIDPTDVTGIVLGGGRGSRLGGKDKPLIELDDRRVIDHILERIARQVGSIVISCSRNVALYEALGHRVAVDQEPEQGPLGGLHAAFAAVGSEWAFTVPGDAPFIAEDLVRRLTPDAEANGVAVPFADNERQNLCLLINRERRTSLDAYYLGGGRAVKRWLDAESIIATDLSDLSPSFFNLNNQIELEEAVARARGRPAR